MQRNIRLIGLDLDNTTLNSQKTISPRVQAAIKNAIEHGIVVLPATGRILSGVPQVFLDIPGVRYALTSNGAMVYDLQAGTVVFSDCFEKPAALSILEAALAVDPLASVYLGGKAYIQCDDFSRLLTVFPEDSLGYMKTSRTLVPNLHQLVTESAQPVEKFSILFADANERADAKALFEARGDCTVTSSFSMNLELNTPTANKGAALLALGRLLGIPKEGVMAMGDGSNDLEMMKAVGYSVAMGNAHPNVLAAATTVTATANEDGVALAIEAVLEGQAAAD